MVIVAICCDGLLIYRQVSWRNVTHKEISVLMEKSARKYFRDVVRCVDGNVDTFENDKVTLHPVAQRKVFNNNVTCAWSRFLGIAHRCTTVVVLVSHSSRLLWDIEIPKDTSNIEAHATNIACCHKFSLSGR